MFKVEVIYATNTVAPVTYTVDMVRKYEEQEFRWKINRELYSAKEYTSRNYHKHFQ